MWSPGKGSAKKENLAVQHGQEGGHQDGWNKDLGLIRSSIKDLMSKGGGAPSQEENATNT